MTYSVYILECADSTYYIGSTKDIQKRLCAHNEGKSGAKYTRGRRPVVLRYREDGLTRGEALKREAVLKKLSRFEKQKLFKKD